MLKMEKIFFFSRNHQNMFRGKWLGSPIKHYNRHQGQYADLHLCEGDLYVMQSGALSLVGIGESVLSLVESFIELKYFHDVATIHASSLMP